MMKYNKRKRLVPCLATMTLAIASGILVPAARKVIPITLSGIDNAYPIYVTLKKKKEWIYLFTSIIKCNYPFQMFAVGKKNNPFQNKPWFLRVCSTRLLKTLWEKGEIARNEQFLLFLQCFLPYLSTVYHFYQLTNCRLQNLSIWMSLKFVVWEKVKNIARSLTIHTIT